MVLENQSAVGSPIAFTNDGKYLLTANIDDFLQINALNPAQPAPAEKVVPAKKAPVKKAPAKKGRGG
jgi:hypothetical protein